MIKKKSKIALLGLGVFVLLANSCVPKKKVGTVSESYSMNISGRQVKSEIRDSASLLAFMKENNYYSTAIAQAGVAVYYSTSYETDAKNSSSAEAGQAYGGLKQADGGLFFAQQDNTTTQALLPPGAGSRFGSGLSRWKFDGSDGYAQLVLDVATNQRAKKKGQLHPGYNQMEVAMVSFTGGTSGGQVQYADALEVTLVGGESRAELYFAKGLGPVATEFREKYMPAGTAKVYLQANGGRQ